MRIFLVPGVGIDPSQGGQGSFCRFLAEGLIELGHTVEIAADRGWEEFCKKSQILLHKSGSSAPKNTDIVHVNGPGVRHAVSGLLHRHKVVLTHQDHRYICPATTAWTPVGCDKNGSPGPCSTCPRQGLGGRARLAALRAAAANCANVAVSAYLLRRLALPNGRAILSPIRLESHSSPQDGRLIAFAGRLVPEKGAEVLLRALSQLDDARLEIAGDGPLLPDLQRLADDLRVAPRVRFLGRQPLQGVRELYLRAAVVCVPSLWHEPFGYTAAEAMALGRPLIASDRGALPELTAGERGWTCAAADAHDWATTLREVLADGDERERRRLNAARFVGEELNPRRVAQHYAEVYESCLGHGTKARAKAEVRQGI